MADSSKAVRFSDGGAADTGLNPMEKVVEGVKGVVGSAADTVLEHTPGTAEHALKAQLEQEGDMSVDTGAPLPPGRCLSGSCPSAQSPAARGLGQSLLLMS